MGYTQAYRADAALCAALYNAWGVITFLRIFQPYSRFFSPLPHCSFIPLFVLELTKWVDLYGPNETFLSDDGIPDGIEKFNIKIYFKKQSHKCIFDSCRALLISPYNA